MYNTNNKVEENKARKYLCVGYTILFSDLTKLDKDTILPMAAMAMCLINGIEKFYYGNERVRSSYDLFFVNDAEYTADRLAGLSFFTPKRRRSMTSFMKDEILISFTDCRFLDDYNDLGDLKLLDSKGQWTDEARSMLFPNKERFAMISHTSTWYYYLKGF